MIVVDCSVVVDALLGEDMEVVGDRLSATGMAAPMLIDFEVVAAIRGLVLGKRVSAARAEEALSDYDILTITRWGSAPDLRQRILQLRDKFSAHDGAYVALAEALECPLFTRDRRLARAAGGIVEVQTG